MSKINQIQNAILELDGGTFQKLADAYLLLKKGYSVSSINSIGSVIGKNKTKIGTPDTLITHSNGKYVFAEYTTQQSGVFKKFSDDIDKCFNTDKTGIAVDKIEEVVLCYTSELLSTEIEQLRQKCEKVGINFNQYGMSTISYDLLEKYPQLAEEFLNISIDTGQIVELSSFIVLYSKNKLATTLETNFYFREKDKSKTLDILNTNNLVIISGQAGVGKTRFAIECFKDFMSSNSSYKGYCIFNKNTDLYNDIQCYFSDSGNCLVFVDDANRLSSNFQYILQLLHAKRDNQYFKIIVTVRDYALEKIKELCKPYEDKINEINLQSLENREIEKLLQEQFEINHHLYLEQITRIAHGNPRLAIMAAKVAKESNAFESIKDVSTLYDEYFSAIKHDLELLKDENILKIAGIISFFRSIDKNDEPLMSLLQETFKISASEFWEKSNILHNMEIFDIFENEVIKISDQILGTYLIYLVFFREKILSVSGIINEKIFSFFKQGIKDAIYPILNTFNPKKIEEVLQPTIDKEWDYFYKNLPYNFVEFINTFWFLKPTETLIFVEEQIDRLSDKVESETNSLLLPPFISVLSNFAGADRNTLKIAIDLYLSYLKKQPQYVSKIKDIFIHSYGIQRDSYLLDYQIQFDVCEKILEYCDFGHNEYFSKFFISLAEKHYLHTHFDCTKWEKKDTAVLIRFHLLPSPELFKFRELVWNSLFLFYKNNKNVQLDILNLILSYSKPSLYVAENAILEEDSKLISTFFKDNLDSTNLFHCIVVQEYLKSLKSYKIVQVDNLELFSSDNYKYYNFITDQSEKIELRLSSDKYHEYLKRKINKLFSSFTIDKYKQFIQALLNVAQLTNNDNDKWRIEHSIISILEELFERDSQLYIDVITDCLEIENFSKLNSIFLVKWVIEAGGLNRAFEIVSNVNDMWLFNYYKSLTRENIQKKHIDGLLKLYSILDKQYFTYNIDHLLEYESVEGGFIIKVIQTIISRANKEDILISNALYFLFSDKKSKLYQQVLKMLFSTHLELIKETYLTVDKNKDSHIDYNGTIFSEILDNDPNFIDDYLQDKLNKVGYLNKYNETQDYSFLWQRDDYIDIMKRISNTIFKCENHHDYFEFFFNKSVCPQTEDEIIKRQDIFLSEEINIKYHDRNYVRFLFDLISSFDYKRKVKFYHQFLKLNKNINDFKNLIFDPTGLSWSGSIIPLLHEKIDFYNLIISEFTSVQFLKHREFIEQKIKRLRKEIKAEQKRDFIENS